jgi:hypothetical protein
MDYNMAEARAGDSRGEAGAWPWAMESRDCHSYKLMKHELGHDVASPDPRGSDAASSGDFGKGDSGAWYMQQCNMLQWHPGVVG